MKKIKLIYIVLAITYVFLAWILKVNNILAAIISATILLYTDTVLGNIRKGIDYDKK